MQSFTKRGFLYYEFATLHNKPGIIIYSDKQVYSEYFSTAEQRLEYQATLEEELKKAGITSYNIPYTAIWLNTSTLLSVKQVNNLIVLEFPWDFSREIKYWDNNQLLEVYEDIQKHLNNDDESDIEELKRKVDALEDDLGTETENRQEGDITLDNKIDAVADDVELNKQAIEDLESKISGAFHYKGSVENYSDLPTEGQEIGDVWNIVNADPDHEISAGDNVAWNGTSWDNLRGIIDLTPYLTKIEASELYNTKEEIDAKDIETIKSILGRVWSTSKYPTDASKGYFKTTYTQSSGSNAGSYALLFNESDGGGSQYYNKNANILSYVGTNDGGNEAGAICVQIYSKDKTSNVGSRFNVNPTGMYYTTGKTNGSFTEADEIAVKGDIDSAKTEINTYVQESIENAGVKVITRGITLVSSVEDGLDPDFPYLNTFAISDAVEDDLPSVRFIYEESISGNWSAEAITGNGILTIRSKNKIEDASAIDSVVLFRVMIKR